MMQKFQRFGAAMFVPVMLFSFAGIVVALGSLLINCRRKCLGNNQPLDTEKRSIQLLI